MTDRCPDCRAMALHTHAALPFDPKEPVGVVHVCANSCGKAPWVEEAQRPGRVTAKALHGVGVLLQELDNVENDGGRP